MLPYVGLGWTVALSVVIGIVLASAFPAIIVYAQDMLTHRIGMVSGLFYGFSFGLGGIGAAVLGVLADRFGIDVRISGLRLPAATGLVRGVPAGREAAPHRGMNELGAARRAKPSPSWYRPSGEVITFPAGRVSRAPLERWPRG